MHAKLARNKDGDIDNIESCILEIDNIEKCIRDVIGKVERIRYVKVDDNILSGLRGIMHDIRNPKDKLNKRFYELLEEPLLDETRFLKTKSAWN